MEKFFEYEPKIVKQLARKVKDQSAREDLLHEVFIKFAAHYNRLAHQDNLCGYLHRVADNAIVDYFRRENKFFLTGDETVFEKIAVAPPAAAAEDADYKLADCCLRSFISGLPPKYGEALILTELEGKSQNETAEELGLSYSGLKSRIQRAREMLKKAILDCYDYEFDKYGSVVGCCNGKKN